MHDNVRYKSPCDPRSFCDGTPTIPFCIGSIKVCANAVAASTCQHDQCLWKQVTSAKRRCNPLDPGITIRIGNKARMSIGHSWRAGCVRAVGRCGAARFRAACCGASASESSVAAADAASSRATAAGRPRSRSARPCRAGAAAASFGALCAAAAPPPRLSALFSASSRSRTAGSVPVHRPCPKTLLRLLQKLCFLYYDLCIYSLNIYITQGTTFKSGLTNCGCKSWCVQLYEQQQGPACHTC